MKPNVYKYIIIVVLKVSYILMIMVFIVINYLNLIKLLFIV